MSSFESLALRFSGDQLFLLDQRELPREERWLGIDSLETMVDAIVQLKVRGAPLIGVAAACFVGMRAHQHASEPELLHSIEQLRAARPTAVNLMAAMDRMRVALTEKGPEILFSEALAIAKEDVELCEQMAEAAGDLIQDGESVLTHCNTGGLATVGVGTALGAIRWAFEQGRKIHVYVDETRPLLQGARLTAYELGKLGIPYTLICDNMAAALMNQGKVNRVLVGADRIACNGDFANKIGTYGLSVLAHHHEVPFHVVAPRTTFDPKCESGAHIEIEQRSADEVRGAYNGRVRLDWAPSEAQVYNPAFDVTPAHLVTSWILDGDVFRRPDFGKRG